MLSQLIRYESSNWLLIASIAIVTVFAIISFNNPNLFNLVFISLTLSLVLLHSGHRDLITLFAILGVSRLFGELCDQAFLFDLNIVDALEFRLIIYAVVAIACILLRYQLLSKIILFSLIVVIPIEIYWFTTDYPAPSIHYYYITLLHTIILRYVLIMRSGIFRFIKGIQPQNLDFNLSELMCFSAIINLLLIIEYLIRHLSGKPLLLVYSAFPILQHILACASIMIILFYTISHPKMLKV